VCGLGWREQSAVSSTSPMGSPIAAATPMGMGVKVVGAGAAKRDANGMGRTGHGIPVSRCKAVTPICWAPSACSPGVVRATGRSFH
jgi:hypothetical protein